MIHTNKETLADKAKTWAEKCHADTNHLYDGKPYIYHLNMVAFYGHKFLHLIPFLEKDTVIAACFTHDVIEDARQTYNDVKKELGEKVAELVYALTNEKGRSRKERANEKYYIGIRDTPHATFVKLCDRMANIDYSKTSKSDMFEKYRKENEEFIAVLYKDEYREMFAYLRNFFKDN